MYNELPFQGNSLYRGICISFTKYFLPISGYFHLFTSYVPFPSFHKNVLYLLCHQNIRIRKAICLCHKLVADLNCIINKRFSVYMLFKQSLVPWCLVFKTYSIFFYVTYGVLSISGILNHQDFSSFG